MWIWKLKVPNKIKSFFWLLFHDRLPAGSFLQHIRIQLDTICCFRNRTIKTSSHIFFECPNANTFWTKLASESTNSLPSHVSSFNSKDWQSIWDFLKKKPFNSIINWEDLFPFCFWQIWLTRNNNLFNKRKDMVNLKPVMAKTTEYFTISISSAPTNNRTTWVKWMPPPPTCTSSIFMELH